MFDTKAKFAISDAIKNYDPMGDPTTQQICGAKKELWTVSEIVEQHMKQLMHTYNKHKSQVGKLVTKGYRAKYNTTPVRKVSKRWMGEIARSMHIERRILSGCYQF